MLNLIKISLARLLLSISSAFLLTFFAFGQSTQNEKGEAEYKAGNYQAAIDSFTEAWNLGKLEYGETNPKTLRYASNLATAYQDMGKFKEALKLNQSILDIRSQILPQNHEDILAVKNKIAINKSSLGQEKESIKIYEEIYALRKTSLGEKDPKTIQTLNNIAYSLQKLGKLNEALELDLKVVELRKEVLGIKNQNTLNSLNTLSSLYSDLGNYQKALEIQEEVFKLRKETLGEKHPSTISSMSSIALLYRNLGRNSESLLLDEKVLKLRTELLGPTHPATLASMNNLAINYGILGRNQERVNLYEKILDEKLKTIGEKNQSTLRSMNNLAISYRSIGKDKESLELNKKTYELAIDNLGYEHPITLEIMASLATGYNRNRDYSKAFDIHSELLKIRSKILGDKHPNTISTMSSIAATYGNLGKYKEQLEIEKEVYELRSEILGKTHPHTLNTVYSLSKTYQNLNDISSAANLSSEYINGAELIRQQAGLSSENRQGIFEKYANTYRNFAVLKAEESEIDEAFRISELSKARTLLESMSSQIANKSSHIPTNDRKKLELYTNQIDAITQLIEKSNSPEEKRNLELNKNNLVTEYQNLQNTLKAKYPKYSQLSDVKIIGKGDLNNLIPQKSIAISYLINGQSVSAFVISPNGNINFKKLGDIRYLGDNIEIARKYISTGDRFVDNLAIEGKKPWQLSTGDFVLTDINKPPPKDATPLKDGKQLISALSKSLVEPLETFIQGNSLLIISPDGPLSQLPFEVLEYKSAQSNLISQFSIDYTQSLSTYALSKVLQSQLKNISNRKSLLAVGNPEYLNETPQTPNTELTRSAAISNLDKVTDLDSLWNPLPGTEIEVKKISALFPNSNKVLLGKDATEQKMQQLNQTGEIKNYRYILMSAHGYLAPNQPALSSIVLGLRNKSPSADGYITATEWPEYNLKSDLTVLSACDSGIGKIINGEGVMGLPFALFVAGNVNTVLSLWPVDDTATALFMETFFKKLKNGESTADALKHTKEAFMQSKEYKAPKYWAPFILVGAG